MTLTAAIVTSAWFTLQARQFESRRRAEEHYTRLSGYVAEEAEKRITSYSHVAELVRENVPRAIAHLASGKEEAEGVARLELAKARQSLSEAAARRAQAVAPEQAVPGRVAWEALEEAATRAGSKVREEVALGEASKRAASDDSVPAAAAREGIERAFRELDAAWHVARRSTERLASPAGPLPASAVRALEAVRALDVQWNDVEAAVAKVSEAAFVAAGALGAGDAGRRCAAKQGDALEQCVARGLVDMHIAPGGPAVTSCAIAPPPSGPTRVLVSGDRVLLPLWKSLCLSVAGSSILSVAALDAIPEEGFDEVALVDQASRRVLASSHSDSQLRLTSLPEPKPPENVGGWRLDTLALGSAIYRVATQPVLSTVALRAGEDLKPDAEAGQGVESSLLVVGLVRESRLDKRLLRLRPIAFLALVALAALAVSSFPLAKLWLSGPRSRFGHVDLAFLATAAIVSTLLAVLLVLAHIDDESHTARLDDQLDGMTLQVQHELTSKLADADASLDELASVTTPYRVAVAAFEAEQPANTASLGLLKGSAREACARLGDGYRLAVPTEWRYPSASAPVPYCHVMGGPGERRRFWAGKDGRQRLKINPGGEETLPVSVEDRSYFESALAIPCSQDHAPGSPEVVRSLTTTSKRLYAARRTCLEHRADGVVVVQADLSSLLRLAAPQDVQWAVIDQAGKIMLHSLLDQHHGHPFLEDLDRAERLTALLRAGETEGFDAEYRGVPSRFWVKPLPGTNWTVVAIAGRGPGDRILKRSLLATSVAAGLFAGAMALLLAMAVVARGRASTQKSLELRPIAGASRGYFSAGLAMLVGSGLLSLAAFAWDVPMWLLLLGAVALLLGGVCLVPGVLRPSRREADTYRSERLPHTYTLCCFGFACALVVAPTVVLFASFHRATVLNSLRIEQASLMPKPGCVPRADAASCQILPTLTRDLEVSWPCGSRRICPEPILVHHGDGASDGSPSAAHWPIEPLLELLAPEVLPWPAVLSSADGSPSSAGDSAVRRWVVNGSKLWLTLDGPWALQSTIYGLNLTATLWMVVLLLVIATVLVISHFSIRRLFSLRVLVELDRMRREGGAAARSALEGGLGRKVLIVHPGPDLLYGNVAPGALVFSRADLAPPGLASLKALEAAVASAPERLVVMSEEDPMQRATAELQSRWIAALDGFALVEGPGRRTNAVLLEHRVPSSAAMALLWRSSDDDEQRVLAQIALDGHASPHPENRPVLRSLALRGLLEEQTLTIGSDAFAAYVRRAVTREQLAAWQAAEGKVAWATLRIPLAATVTVLLSMVGVSNPELAATGAVFAVPVAGSLPALLRLAAMAATRGRVA